MSEERWLPVVGAEGEYEVSDLGRVRSLERCVVVRSKLGRSFFRCYPGVVMCPVVRSSGHLYVQLGRNKGRFVHTLVLETFVGAAPSVHHEGRHLDGDPSNNRVGNLCWGTRSRNVQDLKYHGGRKTTKLFPGDVCAIRAMFLEGASQYKVARTFGISQSTAHAVKARKIHRDVP